MSPFGPRPHFSPLAINSSSTMPLDPRLTATLPLHVLPACGNEDALGLLERGEDIGSLHDLVKVRRADFFLAFGDQHEVDRELHLGRTHRMKRGEHGRLGSLLIDCAAADDGSAESGLVDDPPFERR